MQPETKTGAVIMCLKCGKPVETLIEYQDGTQSWRLDVATGEYERDEFYPGMGSTEYETHCCGEKIILTDEQTEALGI